MFLLKRLVFSDVNSFTFNLHLNRGDVKLLSSIKMLQVTYKRLIWLLKSTSQWTVVHLKTLRKRLNMKHHRTTGLMRTHKVDVDASENFCISMNEGSYVHVRTCSPFKQKNLERGKMCSRMKMAFLLIILWMLMTPNGESNICHFLCKNIYRLFITFSLSIRDVSLESGDMELDERDKSDMDSTRMFKLRRDLDQLDRFYKQKELNVLKARSAYTHICMSTHLFMHSDTDHNPPPLHLTEGNLIL